MKEFGIQLDVCATAKNAVVPKYFTKKQDAFRWHWTGVCWMNPPYGRDVGRWIHKASWEAAAGATIVCLLPSRTDTRWWHEYVEPILRGDSPGEVRFLKGRLRFVGAPRQAPFPSVVVVFRPPPAKQVAA